MLKYQKNGQKQQSMESVIRYFAKYITKVRKERECSEFEGLLNGTFY